MNSRDSDLEAVLISELKDALHSRQMGKEGRARVCARRAAGWAIGWYVETKGLGESHGNALKHLKWLSGYDGVSEGLRQAAVRLSTTIEADGTLPFNEDPLEDARKIIHAMLGYEIERE
jgi:hypothetical protein